VPSSLFGLNDLSLPHPAANVDIAPAVFLASHQRLGSLIKTRRVQLFGADHPPTLLSITASRLLSVFIWPPVTRFQRLLFRRDVALKHRAPLLSWVRHQLFSLGPADQQSHVHLTRHPRYLFPQTDVRPEHIEAFLRSIRRLRHRGRLLFPLSSPASTPLWDWSKCL
jgi:hypothetical protein